MRVNAPMNAKKMHHNGGDPMIGWRFAANTRLPAAMEVNPEQATESPTTYERKRQSNARWVTKAAPAALG